MPPSEEDSIEHERRRHSQHDTSDDSPTGEDERDPDCVPCIGIAQDRPVVVESQARLEPEARSSSCRSG